MITLIYNYQTFNFLHDLMHHQVLCGDDGQTIFETGCEELKYKQEELFIWCDDNGDIIVRRRILNFHI